MSKIYDINNKIGKLLSLLLIKMFNGNTIMFYNTDQAVIKTHILERGSDH